jgi:hypothetical protein
MQVALLPVCPRDSNQCGDRREGQASKTTCCSPQVSLMIRIIDRCLQLNKEQLYTGKINYRKTKEEKLHEENKGGKDTRGACSSTQKHAVTVTVSTHQETFSLCMN